VKVLLNDGMDEDGIRLFQQAGIETDQQKRDPSTLRAQVGEFDALVVRSATNVTGEVIKIGVKGKLKVVGRAGVGVDNIDVRAATENGVIVKSAPFGNTSATAELALALMLDISRKIPQGHLSLKKGVWRKKPFEGCELSGKTLGILGCGRIGQRLSELVSGFNMETIGYDPVIKSSSKIKLMSKEEVLAQSDFVSIHVSGNESVIGEKELWLMKPTAFLINTARGHNVNEKALYNALKTGQIAGAALDVFEDEPTVEGSKFNNMLRQLDNVIFTPHLGASTIEAQKKTSLEMAKVIIDYLLRGDFSNAVNAGENIELEQRPTYSLFVYHQDKPGMFAKIDKVLADHGINIRENPSRQIGQGCAIAVYLVHQEIGQNIIHELNKLEGVVRANT